MGHSRAEKAESRERILDVAARQIRQGGLDSLSIAEIMKAANLTHGGFYGHFPSRTALIAAALERAMDRGEASFVAARTPNAPGTVKSIVNRYLSPAHRDDTRDGCAIAALSGDVGRAEDDEVRTQMARRLEQSFEDMAKAMGGDPKAEAAAVTAWCAMVGAMSLSRVFRGTGRSDEILRTVRQSILDLDAAVRDGE
ncbi:TetR/AcrR family transcriptional regulator [Phenylobacterium sp.]|uniref:TetR/AcrR family transcriptional regulator n=1 Tax=Phenylobacterium sp. TaxID=1871053 RepID=UPI002733CF5C|nr:TetR/AcrR family transcriptional regulator [Phenylobacterium sp.]MDP3852411.1 TetR/AcrR family transcriptional regulator [Phenylobacterium sp.]